MKIVGKTEDNFLVVADVFEFFDTFYEKLIVLEDIFDKKYKEEILKRISLYIEYYKNNLTFKIPLIILE